MTRIEEFAQIAAGATRLYVKTRDGDVDLRIGEGAAWSLDWESDEDMPPRIVRDGDTVRVEYPDDGWHRSADVRVTAPAGLEGAELHTGRGDVEARGLCGRSKIATGHGDVNVRGGTGEAEVRSGSGDVHVEGFEGRLDAKSGSGDVHVEQARGHLHVASGQGDVQLERVDGEIELRTGHGDAQVVVDGTAQLRVDTGAGDVEILGGALRGLHARSGAGDVSCRAALQPGTYELQTGAGDAEIELSTDGPVRINAQTGMGEISSDFPLVRVGRSGPMGFGGARMVGSVGEGDTRVELSVRTGTGDISIRRAGGGPRVHVSPTSVGAGGWEARIDDERGEISVVRSGDAEPVVSVPMPRGIGAFVRQTIREALGPSRIEGRHRHDDPVPPVPPTPPPAPVPPTPPTGPTTAAGQPANAREAAEGPTVGAERPEPSGPDAPRGGSPERPLPPHDDPTLKVLEALARGEISVDDAQTLLNERR